jgi:hypothetical protein
MQYRWCTGKRGSGSAPDRPRGDSSLRGLVVLMNLADGEIAAVLALLLFLYLCWLRFLVRVHQNRLDRRDYYDPPTGRPWVRPRPVYRQKDLSH